MPQLAAVDLAKVRIGADEERILGVGRLGAGPMQGPPGVECTFGAPVWGRCCILGVRPPKIANALVAGWCPGAPSADDRRSRALPPTGRSRENGVWQPNSGTLTAGGRVECEGRAFGAGVPNVRAAFVARVTTA